MRNYISDSDDDAYASGFAHRSSGYSRVAISSLDETAPGNASSLGVTQLSPFVAPSPLPAYTRVGGNNLQNGLLSPSIEGLQAAAVGKAAAVAQFAEASASMKSGPLSVLDTQLAALYYANSPQAASMQAFVASIGHNAAALDTVNGVEYVTIDAVAKDGDGATLLAQLQQIGLQGGASFGTIASGHLAVDKVADLLSLSDLSFARESGMMTHAGLVTTQADGAQHNDTARTNFTVDGTGVKVGVLSDSFDKVHPVTALAPAGDSMALNITNDDLPTNTTVLHEDTFSGATDEGRGMAQLIHDLAPGASIEFATAEGGIANFANNILALASDGAKVIVDDVAYFAELFYQEDAISQAVDTVAGNGVAYFSSAGNEGTRGYEGAWVGGASKTIGTVSGGSATESFMQFAPGQDYLQINLQFVDHFILQWDQPAASAGNGSPGASSDLDLFITNAAGDRIFEKAISANTGHDPVEVISLSSLVGTQALGTNNYLRVGLFSGSAPTEIKLIWDNNTVANNVASNFNSGSQVGHSAAPGAVGVAAAPYSGTPAFGTTPPAIEDFSSAGSVHYWYDIHGNRLPTAIVRGSPQVTGVDGGNTTFFGSDDNDGDTLPNFYGTSAAAPDVAAIAALMLQAHPGLSPADILARLERSAIDMDDPSTPGFDIGFDYRTGYGLVNADAAVNFQGVLNLPPTIDLNGAAPGSVTHAVTEGDPALLITADTIVTDPDSADFDGGGLTVAVTGSDSGDQLTIVNQGTGAGQIGISGSNVSYEGTAIGTFAGGANGAALVVTFSGAVLPAAAQALANDIQYASTTDDPQTVRTITFTIDDGDADSHTAIDSATIDIAVINDAPALAATAANPTFTEGAGLAVQAAGVSLFSGFLATNEAGQTIALTLTVSGIADGNNEKIGVDGTAIGLGGNSSGTTSTNGVGYGVVVSSGTATVTLTSNSASVLNTALFALTYQNTLVDTPTAGDRVLTLTQIADNGGTASGGHDTTALSTTSTVHVVAVDDAAVAKNDSFTTDEASAVAAFNLFDDHGSGADSDVDGPALSIASVAGGTLGTQFTLASGAKLTVNANGTFSYDPNHAFDSLAPSGSGAANTSGTDHFNYTLANGGTATVTITISGLAGAGTRYDGSGGNDVITGDPALGSLFHLEQGGNDTATGGSGNDGFYFQNQFTGADIVHGGGGTNDQIGLEGDYSSGVTLDGTQVDGVEVLAMLPGFNYKISTLDNFVGSAQTFTFWSVSMASMNHVDIDGHMEGDGKFQFFLGQGDDLAKGGSGDDLFYGEGGADALTGNGGNDTFAYLSAADSNGAGGTAYDSLDFAAGADKIKLIGTAVTAVDAAVSGGLTAGTFDADLGAVLGNGQTHELDAGHAVLFTVTGGGALDTHVFLIVGTAAAAAGYTPGSDYVFDVTTGTAAGLAMGDFV